MSTSPPPKVVYTSLLVAYLALPSFIFGNLVSLEWSLDFGQPCSTKSFSSVTISPKSCFHQIRKWCLEYDILHPLVLLPVPLPNFSFKSLVKKGWWITGKICYWLYTELKGGKWKKLKKLDFSMGGGPLKKYQLPLLVKIRLGHDSVPR